MVEFQNQRVNMQYIYDNKYYKESTIIWLCRKKSEEGHKCGKECFTLEIWQSIGYGGI